MQAEVWFVRIEDGEHATVTEVMLEFEVLPPPLPLAGIPPPQPDDSVSPAPIRAIAHKTRIRLILRR